MALIPWLQDVKVKSSEIDSLPTKSHLFTPGRAKGAVFLTEDQVLLEANFAEEPPEKPPVPDRPVRPELLRDALHEEHGSPQQPLAGEGGSEGESAALARAIGVEQSDLLQQHKKAMQEIRQRRQKELEEIKHAVPDESLNVSNQETLLRQISEGRNREVERQGRGGGDQHHEHKENVYDMVGPGNFQQEVWKPDQHQVRQQGQQPPSQHQIDHQHQNNLQQNGQHLTQPGWQAPDHPLQPDTEQQPGYYQYDHHTSQNVPHTRAPHGPPSAGPHGPLSAGPHGPPSARPHGPPLAGPHGPPSAGPHGPLSAGPHGPPSAGPHGPPSTVPSHRGSSTVPPSPHYLQQHMAYGGQQRSSHRAGLEVGSAVQIANNDSRTGVVRWIGPLPGVQGEVAGVELVSYSVSGE